MDALNKCGIDQQDNIEQGLAFLERVGDDDLLKFLRRLPMVGSNAEGPLTLKDFIYEMRLWPFVKEAWSEVEGSAGVAGRIIQINRVYKLAAERMHQLTGERRRTERMIDVPAFLQAYTSDAPTPVRSVRKGMV
ncbi:hypothetical protein [Algirhabdus cladophorae]|uniref:hypothetical protein n=1 Tax=Algirhabdus cladophorae TaxID=3377108 RepID=UPI003B849DD4